MDADLRTLLVGVDAACEEVLDPLFEAGELPTLRGLFEGGASGRLESQVPPWTASAWPSLYTGTNPGKHGVFDFLDFEGYDWDVVDATAVGTPGLWELLDHHGRSSVVVNVPVTHPPREFEGALVPGYTAPESPACHPPGLLAELRDAIGEYRLYPAHTGEADPDRDAVVAEHVDLAAMRGRAFRHLVDRFDPDFGFLQFQGTDSVVHELPDDRDALREVYGAVDEQVAAVCSACDPDTVLVVSDHGIGPYEGREVRVNDALREAGLLETVRGGEGMPTWARTRDYVLADGEDASSSQGGAAGGALERAMAGLARLGLTSQRVAAVLEPLGLDEVIARIVPTRGISAATEQVDFASSTAYVRSRVECGVRLNLEGREPDGVVPPEEYDAVRRAVVDLLAGLETPDGERVFETVGPREQFFEGPAVEDAADVVTVPAEFDHFLSAQLRGEVFGEPREPWNHKRYGVVAAAGDAVDERAPVEGAHLFDVAPTVLATLDVPVAEHMDGAPLPIVESAGVESYPTTPRQARSTDRSEVVETRLADLGYIE